MNKYFERINCPVCIGRRYKILYKSNLTKEDFSEEVLKNDFRNSLSNYTKHAQIVKCLTCNLVYVNPVEKINTYLEAYTKVVDEEYIENKKFRKVLAGNHLKRLEHYVKKGRILDVGCFAGFFLELAQKNRWKTYGIEPSEWAIEYAKRKGIEIIGKDIDKTYIKSEFFDAVTMWDVIEHLANPAKVIEKIHKSLRQGGILAIGTPDVDSFLFRLLGGNHPYFIRMHLVLFSPKTIKRLLEENGFEILEIYKYGRTYPVNYFLKRAETKFSFIKKLRRLTKSSFFSEHPITLNLHDEFGVIARKL